MIIQVSSTVSAQPRAICAPRRVGMLQNRGCSRSQRRMTVIAVLRKGEASKLAIQEATYSWHEQICF